MKNFNLISPSDNGFEYTIRFQDPIKIMKNSILEFKFAELVRAGEVVFDEEQTITITAEAAACLPQYNLDDGTTKAQPFLVDDSDPVNPVYGNELKLVIPAGVYSYQDFRNTLESTITNGLEKGLVDGDCKLEVFQGFAVNSDLKDNNQRDMAFGIEYNFINRDQDSGVPDDFIEVDSGGEFQMNVEVVNNKQIKKTSGGDDGELDGGAIINPDERYIHRYYKSSNLPPNHNFENFIYAGGLHPTGDQAGDIHIGFYNKECSKTLGEGTDRLFKDGTGGVIPVNAIGPMGDESGENYLPVWLGIRVQGNTGQVEIYQGFNNDDSQGPESVDNQFYDIQAVEVVCSHPVYDLFDEEEQPQFFIQLYQTKSEYFGNWSSDAIATEDIRKNDSRTFYRVYALTGEGTSTSSYSMKEIYDSQLHGRHLSEKFEIGTGITYGAAPNAIEKNRSQMPYQVVVGMTNEGEGWNSIRFPKQRGQLVSGRKGGHLLLEYTMTFSKPLEEALNIPRSGTATELNLTPNFILSPDFGDTNNLHNYLGMFHNSNISNPWRREGYSIFIDLPCNNYKNTSDKLNGGFRKSVVANIPSPFASADIVSADNSNSKIVATYEPFQSKTSELKNNSIAVNSFKITIVDMKTERLAKQLSSSVVNFTIHCPSGDDEEPNPMNIRNRRG
tara:strand:- start:1229 stop:3238 length:2010 start_codon:yes stop_codon:yes gene_type:complete